jgi:cellulose synthase/poly-beta-1,6-N-acetylglucosamine synthase-like glycosyltransferase
LNGFLIFSFWTSLLILVYTYAGYPLLVWLRASLHNRPVQKGRNTPLVSLIISVFNEEKVIRERLENVLALDYPKAKLDIVVVSDGSTDRTHDIVREFETRGVRLLVQPQRLGKTSALNVAVPQVWGEIIVFTDANSMYDSKAILAMMESFLDPSVGCVTGETRLLNPEGSALGENEKSFYSYDTFLKVNESVIGSTVGADGAIFAIRRELYEPLETFHINDFVIPLRIVANGFRVIYEPEAFLYEPTATPLKGGFKRRVRIINRSLWGLFSVPQVLNPFSVGFFSLQIVSRKLLRWTAPVFILLLFAVNVGLLPSPFYVLTLSLQVAFYCATLLPMILPRGTQTKYLNFPFYFCHGNAAALVALVKFFRGERIVIWDPLRR